MFAGATAAAPTLFTAFPAGATSTGVRIVNASGLRLRSGAGTGYGVIASLARGTEVNYLGSGGWANGYEWAHVELRSNGTTGYVAAQYLTSPIQGGFTIGSMVHVDTAGGGRANLRSSPSISAGVITTVSNGLTGEVRDGPISANGYTWYKVWFGDVQGWMASVVLAAGGGSDRPRVKVASGPLRVRQQPGLGGAILGTVRTGAQGFITTKMGQEADGYAWVNVQFDSGLLGWVATDFLVWL
jgi:N-acetylmuramoyl-L-alanine amidase